MIMLLLTNCATILNSRFQDVIIYAGDRDTEIFVNDEKVGSGTATVKMERNLQTQQIRVESEGYKPEFRVHYQAKRAPLYYLSWFPFGVLYFMPPLFDNGAKSYDYEKSMSVKPKVQINYKEDDEKYILLSNTAFNVNADDMVFELYSYKDFYKGKEPVISESSDEDVLLDNSIFTEALNNVLTKYGYTDTVETIFASKTNTLYIGAEVEEVTFKEIYTKRFTGRFGTVNTKINWTVYDYYAVPKYELKLKARSGEFSSNFYGEGVDHIIAMFEDAITASFLELIEKPDVRRLLAEEEVTVPEFDLLSLGVRSSTEASVGNAMKATVTIESEDGHGSGFLVSAEGHLITNYHVVAGKETVDIVLNDGTEIEGAVVRFNDYADLALVKIDRQDSLYFNLPGSKQYEVGGDVYAIGTPNTVELGQTLSKGIVSGLRKNGGNDWIQTDVSVNPGNSGGPLISQNGELLGVVNSKIVGFGVEGIAFCIPAEKISEFLRIEFK